MLNTKKRISINIGNSSDSSLSRHSTPKKTPIYDRLIKKHQDLTLSQMKAKIKRCDSKKKKNLTLSQRLSQCLSDSTQSAKDFLLKSTEQNKSINSQRVISDTPFRKYKVQGWKDNFYTSLLDWNHHDLICAAYDCYLRFYHKTLDQDIQEKAINKHQVGNQRVRVNSIKFQPQNENIAIGYQSGMFKIYDYFKRQFIYSAPLHTERITALDWSDGIIVTGSRDRSFNVLDIRNKKTAINFKPFHVQQILGAKISGSLIATGGNDNHVYIFDIRKPSDYVGEYMHGAAVKSLAWIHDEQILVSGGGTADKKMKFWDYSKGKIIKQIETGSQICSITASKNTKQIVSCQGFSLNQIIVWNMNGKREKTLHGEHSNRVLYSALSPSGKYLASGAGDKKLLLWKLFPEDEKKGELLGNFDLR